jgi:rhodanese-related sulfurtransferase
MFNFFRRNTPNLKELLEKGALVLDVRTEAEYLSGHYTGSINIPLGALSQQIESLKKSGNRYLVVCLSGGRSARAVSMLTNSGIEAENGGGWQSLPTNEQIVQ